MKSTSFSIKTNKHSKKHSKQKKITHIRRRYRLSPQLMKKSNYPPLTIDGEKWYILDTELEKSDAIVARDDWKKIY